MGYNSIEAEDWEVATSGEEMSKLESLLLDKNRNMEHQLTQLKVKKKNSRPFPTFILVRKKQMYEMIFINFCLGPTL